MIARRLAAALVVRLAAWAAWALHLEMSDPWPNVSQDNPTERNEHHGRD